MHTEYDDIKERIAEPPAWYDANGTPRYGAFVPRRLPDIYADECALIEIGCQGCERRFLVAVSVSSFERHMAGHAPLRERIAATPHFIYYGDPPNHIETDHGGSTMSSYTLRVVEYWSRVTDVGRTWQRDPALEVTFPAETEE